MKHISTATFKEVIEAEKSNPTVDFINVCTPAEFKEKHIPGVRNVPLDTLASHVTELAGKRTIYIHCRSGKRGMKAIETLQALGVTADLINVEGGLMAWESAGFATKSLTTRIPIMRQVFIAAALFVLIGLALGTTVHPAYLLISAGTAAGLLFAGITGWCGMALVLGKMAWNR